MSEELLKQILDRLNQMESNMATKQDLTDIRAQMNSRFDTLETKLSFVEKDVSVIKQDVSDIKAAVGRIEENEPADVMGMLKQINAKLEEKDSDVQALNKRLFRVESTLERVTTGDQ